MTASLAETGFYDSVNRLTLSLSMAIVYFPVKYPFSGVRQIIPFCIKMYVSNLAFYKINIYSPF